MWKRLNGSPLPKDLKVEVEETILREQGLGNKIKVCIGTDSQVHGDTTNFATVIVFLREKKGGFMFVKTSKSNVAFSLRARMIDEVARSIEVAYQLCEIFDKLDVELEVHADINTDPHFESNIALKEAMGYIMAMGFIFKAKPDAFASSSCADKLV